MTVQTFDNFKIIENVLTDAQIDTLINWRNNKDYELDSNNQIKVRDTNTWETGLDKIQTINCSTRNTEVIGIPRNEFSFLDTVYDNIFAAVHGSALTLEYPTYFNKYETGGFHGQHWDDARPIPSAPTRLYICTIQLSDTSDYVGGDLQIHKYIDDTCSEYDFVAAPRNKGCAIIYNPMAVHSVSEITSGTRYTLNECAG